MTYFSSSVQGLQHAFVENNMALSVKSDYIIAEDSQDCSKEKIQRIVESAGFCPLISQKRINKNFAFTVSPYKIPDFFNQTDLENSGSVESNVQILPINLKTSDKNEGLYFTGDEITELLTPQVFVVDKEEKVKDKWSQVNSFRSFVTPALSKGLCELISKYAKIGYPIIEIGSGIGYLLEELSNVIRTQPCQDECRLLSKSISTPVYNLDIQGMCSRLSESGKKVPLFFALDVFDTLSPELRKASFLQISQLQNSDDRILIMLDTNPCFDVTIKHLEALHPDHVILPYYPLSNDPAKFSVIIVPKKHIEHKPSQSQLLEIINQESMAIMHGRVSQMQYGLHQIQRKFDLQVINLEDFFVEQVKNELMEAGYETDIHYHNSFTCGDLPKGLSGIKQDLVYKPVTDTATVRQWCLTDEKLLDSLSKKGLSLPDHFNEEFLISLRKKQQKIFGAEILVINAKKI